MQNSNDPLAVAEVYLSYGRKPQAEKVLEEAIRKEPDRIEFQNKLLEIRSGKTNNSRKKMSKSDVKVVMTFFGGMLLLIWSMVEGPRILNSTPLVETALLIGVTLAVLAALAAIRSRPDDSDRTNNTAKIFLFSVGIVAGTVGLTLVTNNHFPRSDPVPVSFLILDKSSRPSKHGLNYYLTIDDNGRSEKIQLQWRQWSKYSPGDHYSTNVGVGLWGYPTIPAIRDR
ncbi:type IV pilus assembly protein FimV [Solimicrobium silvestre]|uniref:Tetratricopeptide repeat n=1 Tax=Solimicrobium silvestre TaxID=2099400 RepID=A0A2S9GXQ5_9BURK|nr:hypothetical protein [Solimicrobium silvestre]PRC92505.1 hypothetical protein S2091_2880 [Solimicrobium silvestre]